MIHGVEALKRCGYIGYGKGNGRTARLELGAPDPRSDENGTHGAAERTKVRSCSLAKSQEQWGRYVSFGSRY